MSYDAQNLMLKPFLVPLPECHSLDTNLTNGLYTAFYAKLWDIVTGFMAAGDSHTPHVTDS